MAHRKWDPPEIDDWEEHSEFRSEDERQLFIGFGFGFVCFPRGSCWPRQGCWPRESCWPRQGCWPRESCWPRQGCWPR